jgi:glycine dehydrogenase
MAETTFAPESTAAESAVADGKPALRPFAWTDRFVNRHIGPNAAEVREMLRVCGFESLDQLIDATVPKSIRMAQPLNLPAARSEHGLLNEMRTLAAQNQIFKSYIGMGYYDTITPPVIQRNVIENPGWYTPYTPYQAEISQGRLEALLNFQTLVTDLTGMEIANASLLDEGTAAAEAMQMAHSLKVGGTSSTSPQSSSPAKNVGDSQSSSLQGDHNNRIFVSDACHPQTIDVLQTRAKALGIEVVVGNHNAFDFSAGSSRGNEAPSESSRVDQSLLTSAATKKGFFAALVQYPNTYGSAHDYRAFVEKAHANDALVIVASDLLALTLLTPPGEWGADVVVGSAQRFGVPLGYGGPHAAFFATRDAFKREMPGRLVGVSKDSRGLPALRLTLQTREQHIRREKATSNICTAQALLANVASFYACYHGPEGLKAIARRVHLMATVLASALRNLGFDVNSDAFFDTLQIGLGNKSAKDLIKFAEKHRVNLRYVDAHSVGVSLDETVSQEDLEMLLKVFNNDKNTEFNLDHLAASAEADIPAPLARTSKFLQHPVFNKHHSETEMMRYIRKLEAKDFGLDKGMIPLGSCTMKLNAAAEMYPVTWPEFGRIHPFAPLAQTRGYQQLFAELEEWLAEITGFSAVSLQPNAGSQGELAGLLVIRAYHESRNEAHRNVCLIPTSAHGTNPASAVMAGMKVIAVACDQLGNINVDDLRAKAAEHKANLACLMMTYPSTHGVFEETVVDICDVIHQQGGQVYMDGANMNAQVGLCRPGDIGADVCHLNLHKTFCIPHGGGGPGMGPICVAEHLADFLPGHTVVNLGGENPIGSISAAPWGSASILTIPWVYIRLMGPDGLTEATKVAILTANYVARRLEKFFPVLYKGTHGTVAHECILDLRRIVVGGTSSTSPQPKSEQGLVELVPPTMPVKLVTAEDVAKRLMDYGFHAPTLSWPVPGTLMVEPTESEDQAELDRFCDAMIAIHGEIQRIEKGEWDKTNNPLKNAPHPADVIAGDDWNRPYTRAQAAYPLQSLRDAKYWPPVGRVDNVFGDRNVMCSCAGMEAYQS